MAFLPQQDLQKEKHLEILKLKLIMVPFCSGNVAALGSIKE